MRLPGGSLVREPHWAPSWFLAH